MAQLNGGCLCGAVRYSCSGEPMITGHCHCLDCRKSSGTGHCTHVAIADAGFKVEGAVKLYDKPANSGNVVTRAFCPECGSPLFSTNSAMAGMVFLRASCLDDPNQVTPTMTVYTSRAPVWDHIASDTACFAAEPEGGAERVMAELG